MKSVLDLRPQMAQNEAMIWVGLTGGIASGKSTVSEIFASLGVPVVHADRLARQALAKGSEGARKVRTRFGDDVFDEAGEIDRVKLGAKVFGPTAQTAREDLEKIVHPEVRRAAEAERKKYEAAGAVFAIYEIPLLFEKNLEDSFDLIITVAVSPQVQRDRLIARQMPGQVAKLDREAAEARIASQLPQDHKVQRSDYVIWNDSDLNYLKVQTERVARELSRPIWGTRGS